MQRHVVTMDDDALRKAAGQLEDMVTRSGFVPDVLISIKTGGEYVGNLMFDKTEHTSTLLQRTGTKRKTGLLSIILGVLPQWLCNRLRILEAWWLSKRKHERIDPNLVILPSLSRYERILIVDDAVDSGITLDAVHRAVKLKYPHADVMTAVITVTTTSPVEAPDFALFDNMTLIRFPWSKDY